MISAQDESVSSGNSASEHSSKAAELFLKAVRLYTLNTPIPKGKYRLFMTALRLVKNKPRNLFVKLSDGRSFHVDLTTGMQEMLYFTGSYEKSISDIASRLIPQGGICIDAGANFGWYTTLMAKCTGRTGAVHSFEPAPTSFLALTRNIDLIPEANNIYINNVALGDEVATVNINLFPDQPTGHASLSARGDSASTSFECPMTTLDNYMTDHAIDEIAFVKADVEGAELKMLEGAEKLFKQKVPPVILMEMALEQSKNFGYVPDDLIQFISRRRNYSFFKVDEMRTRLEKIDGFSHEDIGANVFCIPDEIGDDVKQVVRKYLI